MAIKVVSKIKVAKSPKHEKLMRGELEALEELDHPNIVRIIELLETDDNYYIVMELMLDGSLLEILNKFARKGISLTERDIANLLN